MSDTWNKVTVEANLVSLPDIYWRLKELLDSHDYAMPDVAHLIAYDPGLTARLLRIVNSAFFGFANQIETVSHAVSILGVQQIEDLVLTTAIADALGDYECEHLDVKQFWQHSVYRAIAARGLAAERNLIDSERLFVAGLLCGIGHLIMYQSVPVLAQRARRLAEEGGIPLHLAEREEMGFDHGQVAATLMQNWRLPESLVAIVRDHLEPDPASGMLLETSIVHIATLISNAFARGQALDQNLVQASPHAWDAAGLEIEQCLAIETTIAAQLGDVMVTLFPKMQRAAG